MKHVTALTIANSTLVEGFEPVIYASFDIVPDNIQLICYEVAIIINGIEIDITDPVRQELSKAVNIGKRNQIMSQIIDIVDMEEISNAMEKEEHIHESNEFNL